MNTAVDTVPIGFLSQDKKSTIKGMIWKEATPRRRRNAAKQPRGIIHIIHGMAEYVGRYDEFARHLVNCGYVVCGSDHIGHGKSVSNPTELGNLPPDGKEILIADVHEMRKTVTARYSRQTPYIMFGHSMGSFIVRTYLARYGNDVSAAILCGTAQPSSLASKAGNMLSHLFIKTKGQNYHSRLVDNMGVGAYAKQIKDARTPHDWINTDPEQVDAYEADELCGYMFSVGGYAALTDITAEMVSLSCVTKVPKNLPVLFISGEDDPVGDCGKGVHKAAEVFRQCGIVDVEEKLYKGMRHEILNEPDRIRVYTDVVNRMEERLCPKPMS